MIETTGQLETIEWTKEFLKWLPDLYKSNIFEAIKSIEIGLVLERPNMTWSPSCAEIANIVRIDVNFATGL